MATDPVNPFGFPGFQQLTDSAHGNPLATSLEVMRTAMQSFGTSAGLASDSITQTMNVEDLERRIADLNTVKGWLQLNVSILTSTIQGLEVQLATIKTLRSFLEMGAAAAGTESASAQPSPLEIVLGLKKAPEKAPEKAQDSAAKADQPADDSATSAASGEQDAPDDLSTVAAKAWWDMLQNQFLQLAAATAQATQVAPDPVESTAKPAAKAKAATKAATKTTTKSAESADSADSTKATKSAKAPETPKKQAASKTRARKSAPEP